MRTFIFKTEHVYDDFIMSSCPFINVTVPGLYVHFHCLK